MPRNKRTAHPVEAKVVAAADDAPTFEGILSTSDLDLGNWLYRDIVHPGAFSRTLDHFHAAADPYIPLLDSHDDMSVFAVVGKMLDAEERTKGERMELWTRWEVLADAEGDRIMKRLRQGLVRKMSMGYIPVRYDFDEDPDSGEVIRNLREVQLVEGSLVTFPMNPAAEVIRESVKSLRGHVDDEAELDRLIATCHGDDLCITDLRKRAAALLTQPHDTPDDPDPSPAEDGPATTDDSGHKATERRPESYRVLAESFVRYGRR